MEPFSPLFLLTFAATVAGLALIAWRPRLRGAEDFTLAGRSAGAWHVAGAIMGTLVGGASTLGTAQLAFRFGLSAWWFTLGAGTTLQLDVLARFGRGGGELRRLRLVSFGVLLSALALLLFNLGSTILQWSFLSMGLRGATLCLPLLAAVFLRGRAPSRAGALAIFLAPVGTVAAGLAGWPPVPPLYPGLGLALLLLLAGLWLERKQ